MSLPLGISMGILCIVTRILALSLEVKLNGIVSLKPLNTLTIIPFLNLILKLKNKRNGGSFGKQNPSRLQQEKECIVLLVKLTEHG